MVSLALANALHHRTRTLLSVVIVALQAALTLLIVGLAEGTLHDIAERLRSTGADVLLQPPGASLLVGSGSARMPQEAAALVRSVPGVRAVAPGLLWSVSRLGGRPRAINLWAVDYPSFAEVSGGLAMLEGRAPIEAGDLVMDTTLSRATGVKMGDVVPLLGRSFHVAGISRPGAGARLYARLADLQEALEAPGQVSFFLIRKDTRAETDEVVAALGEAFPRHTITPMSVVSQALRASAIGLVELTRALTALAAVLCFLTVLLVTQAAVLERTRQIGILRALGLTQAGVLRVVLLESLGVCLAGILGGTGLASAGAGAIPRFFPTLAVRLALEWGAPLLAVVLAGGFLGALVPALRAARMDPVRALDVP